MNPYQQMQMPMMMPMPMPLPPVKKSHAGMIAVILGVGWSGCCLLHIPQVTSYK